VRTEREYCTWTALRGTLVGEGLQKRGPDNNMDRRKTRRFNMHAGRGNFATHGACSDPGVNAAPFYWSMSRSPRRSSSGSRVDLPLWSRRTGAPIEERLLLPVNCANLLPI
jgi:hypothetical protein